MAKKPKQEEPKGFESVENTLSRTEQFIEDNYKQLLYGLAVVAVIVAAFWLIRMRINNQAKDALAQIYVAEDYFAKDSLQLALHGDGNYLGFLDIAKQYKATKPGNLANYYAGVCYLHLGEFEDAIEYLGKFKKKDEAISPLALACIGDAYVELGNNTKGTEFYMKAVEYSENEFYCPLYLMKAAQLYELDGNKQKALELYSLIKKDYKSSNEGSTIDKHIARVSK